MVRARPDAMSLQIAAALRGGLDRLVSRTGGLLTIAYALVYVVYQASFNGIVARVYEQYGIDTAGSLQPAAGGPLWLQGAAVLACLLALSYLTIVAIRTFVAESRGSFPEGAFSDGIAWALVNLAVGGIVFTLLYWIGLVALVLPGLFVAVSFLFMPIYIAVEGDHFVDALRHSWGLATDNRLRIFGLLLVLFAIGGVLGGIVGFGSAMIAIVGGSPGLFSLLLIVLIAPVSLFGLAVTADAYEQLREDDDGEFGGDATATTSPSTPA